MRISIDQKVPAYKSYAAERTRGMYNVAAEDGQRFQLDLELPVEKDEWQIGMVVGPSGSGKSSTVRMLEKAGWKEWTGGRWPKDQPIIEVLGKKDYGKATSSLAAVGLGSVPSWLRPHHVLSTGEQFRADMASLLLSGEKQVMLDEFTSVLDRQVAQVGAGAFAKSWRRKPGRRVILVTCHYDVVSFIEPDWLVDTAEGLDEFHSDRGVLRPQSGVKSVSDRERYPGPIIGVVKARKRKLIAYTKVSP